MKVPTMQDNQRAVLRYLMPVYDMRKDELENAVIELRKELCDVHGLQHPEQLMHLPR